MMNPDSKPIRARIRVDYDGYALDADLNLPGEGITALFGPSGAGKSTFLRVMAGLERTRDSYIEVGEEVWLDDAKKFSLPTYQRPLGFVFQDVHLFEHLDVRGNLEFGMRRVPVEDRRISLDSAIELLGIGHLTERRPSRLSGGERQRVGIARALATSPRVLMLDEPLSALDMQRKAEIMPYLELLNAELKIPILYVSHALDEVARLADRLVLLDKGRVLAFGPTDELLTRFDLPLAYGDTAAALVYGWVDGVDPVYKLARVGFAGGSLLLPNDTVRIGQQVRLRIQARDVSLALERQSGTSILNSTEATVIDLSDDAVGQVMVGVEAGSVRLLSRITKKSAETLGLEPGKRVFAQVKGIAIV